MTEIIFVDVAAGYKGAHNLGFLESLSSSSLCDFATHVSVAVHCSICSKQEDKLHKNGVQVIKHFTQNFYELFEKDLGIVEAQPYIFSLSQEYRKLLEILPNKNSAHLVFHTMSWEHIQALSLALRKIKRVEFIIHIFLMYWCGVGSTKKDLFLMSQYKLGLLRLFMYNNIMLYTSNYEYKENYEHLLDSRREISLHPFFLGDWNNGIIKKIKSTKEKVVLLYFGELKASKKFYQLPELFQKLLQCNEFIGYRFIVHSSRSKINSKQKLVYESLKKTADNQSIKMDFIFGFLSNQELHNLFNICDFVVLNYDKTEYFNKTSGVLWLAIQYNVICIVTKNTWLQRELSFMNLNHYMIDNHKVSYVSYNGTISLSTLKYRDQIFSPFFSWLKNLEI